MKWHNITSQQDADKLMEIFGEFHDSCIHETRVSTDYYVTKDLSMHCNVDKGFQLSIIFHRQFDDPIAIELVFEELIVQHYLPPPPNYDAIIMCAKMIVENDVVYWSDYSDWNPHSNDKNDATWFSGKKVKWRDCSDTIRDK